MFKFLHLADVHLDTTFLSRTPVLRSKLREALRTSFSRAVDCAIEERVHAMLIAGDLFDNERLSFATECFLLEQCHRLHAAEIPCFYASGNHDPGGGTYRGGRIEWPPSFRFFGTREPEVLTVRDTAGAAVARLAGMGHATMREDKNLARLFPDATGRLPHVGLLHTYVTSAENADSHDRYAPCALEDLRRPGYRYWALGHIHARQQVCDISDAWYPGNIQGRNPRETGPKGGLLVTIQGSGPPRVEFRSFAPLQWAELEINDLADVHTFCELEERTRAAFDVIRSEGVEEWLLRIVLGGQCPLAGELHGRESREEVEELLMSSLGVADVDIRLRNVTVPIDIARHRGEPHLLGAVLDLLDTASRNKETLAALGPEVLTREHRDPESRDFYLRSLLKDLHAEAASRLLRGEAI